MSGGPLTRCADVAPLLVFYACDEVGPQEREQIDAHLAICPTCARQLGEESMFRTAFAETSQPADELDPSGALLAQCRSELSERLDDLQAPQIREHWMPFGWVRRWDAVRAIRRHRLTVCLNGSPTRRFSFFSRLATSSSMVSVVRTS